MDHRLTYILTGSSGSGKSTMAYVLEEQLGLRRCITSTTRPPRAGETHGVDYYFEDQLDPAKLFEHATFGGYEYGINWEELSKGDFIILDPQGVDYYRTHYPHKLTVILFNRNNIEVDPARMARDRAAGFDQIRPDILVQGDTIQEMSENLIRAIKNKPHLDHAISKAIHRANTNSPQQDTPIPRTRSKQESR